MYISKKVDIENLTILNDAITITLREYLQSILKEISTYGYTLLIIGFALIIFGNTVHGLKYYSEKRKSVHWLKCILFYATWIFFMHLEY